MEAEEIGKLFDSLAEESRRDCCIYFEMSKSTFDHIYLEAVTYCFVRKKENVMATISTNPPKNNCILIDLEGKKNFLGGIHFNIWPSKGNVNWANTDFDSKYVIFKDDSLPYGKVIIRRWPVARRFIS